METLRALLSGCMASLSFSSPKASAEALPEVFPPCKTCRRPSHTANICRIKRLPTLTERLCEIAVPTRRHIDVAMLPELKYVDIQLPAQVLAYGF